MDQLRISIFQCAKSNMNTGSNQIYLCKSSFGLNIVSTLVTPNSPHAAMVDLQFQLFVFLVAIFLRCFCLCSLRQQCFQQNRFNIQLQERERVASVAFAERTLQEKAAVDKQKLKFEVLLKIV